jgi:SHS family lactate transporter-like MFS transporter
MSTGIVQHWKQLTSPQKNAFIACFLGWTLDAFDFFVLTYCVSAIAADFHVALKQVTEALFWTLAMRPLGALIFGALAEKIGRRPTLMINIVSFCIFEVASGFAPTLTSLLICRALFGIAMGGEWGVGAALAFETLPEKNRGFFSGLLQEGYVVGNLLAATVYGLVFSHLPGVGSGLLTNWRLMFFIGAAPAILVFYIRSKVGESPAFLAGKAKAVKPSLNFSEIVRYLPNFLFLVLLMTAFTSFSHGTQDLYPTFLQKGKGFVPEQVGWVSDIGHIGALLGGITFGTLSERWGRRRSIVIAALLAIPMIYMWAFTFTPIVVAAGGFLMQFMVQGAWGIVPAHLNELAPAAVRATFPGLAYQLGNLLSSKNGTLQATMAEKYFKGQLGPVMAITVAVVGVAVALLAGLGREAKGQSMSSVEDVTA